MLTVELRRVPDGGTDYTTVATVTVADDGTYELRDPGGYVPVDLHVLVAHDGPGFRPVTLDEDPATWARNLHSVLRTGYLVPVVTHDDERPEGA